MRDQFDAGISRISYQPFLTPEHRIAWREISGDGQVIIHTSEPNTKWYQRAAVGLIGLLPVEWLL
jgi:putative cardiolipin synthase